MTVKERFQLVKDYMNALEPEKQRVYCQTFSKWWAEERPEISKNLDMLIADIDTCHNIAESAANQ